MFSATMSTTCPITLKYRSFKIDVPEDFNFGFDIIDAWANKDRNKLAMIWVDQVGKEKKYTFWDLMRLSNQIVNMMIKYGVNKGDRVLIMLPRVPEWWTFTLALIKRGAVYCPAPTMLTPKDLKYRINIADIKMVITSEEHADKIDEIAKDCPTLSCRMMVDGKRAGWIQPTRSNWIILPRFGKTCQSSGMKKTRITSSNGDFLHIRYHRVNEDGVSPPEVRQASPRAHCNSEILAGCQDQ